MTRRFVRNEIERAACDDLELGIQTECFNMRGITMRGMFDGGGLERELADTYQAHARVVAQDRDDARTYGGGLAAGCRT